MNRDIYRKFIKISVFSVGIVFIAMIITLNGLYLVKSVQRADDRISDFILHGIPEYRFNNPGPPIAVIHGKASGEITCIDFSEHHAIKKGDVYEVFAEVASSDKERGFASGCRFLKIADGDDLTVYIVPFGEVLDFGLTVLLTSACTALADFIIIGALIIIQSRRIMRPIIRRSELQRQFITDAGHELKTPISIIAASADVLDVDSPDNEWVNAIKKQSVRMSSLVSDLILLAKAEEGYTERGETFSISDAVWDMSSDFAAVAASKNISFNCEIEDDISFSGSPAGIGRLISVLLDNAVKYTDSGGTIWLSLRHDRHNIVFRVKNTCDIQNVSDLDKLFERFYRADFARSRSTGGSGIGLSIARSITEAHGGTISASGEKGKYIEFTVKL